MKTICSEKKPTVFIAIGESQFHEKINILLKSQIPYYFAIPISTQLTQAFDEINFPVSEFTSEFISLNAKIVQKINEDVIVILFSSKTDIELMLKLIQRFSQSHYKTLLINYSDLTDVEISDILSKTVRTKNRLIYLIEKNFEIIIRILKLAKQQNVIKRNYFWIIISSSHIHQEKVLSLFDYEDIPNVATISSVFMENCTNNCNIIYYKTKKILDLLNSFEMKKTLFLNCSRSNFREKMFYKNQIMASVNVLQFTNSLKKYLIFTTKSVDQTLMVPNIFTYSTKFEISAFSDLSNNQKLYLTENTFFHNIFLGFQNKTIFICSPQSTPGNLFLSNSSMLYVNETTGLVPMILQGLEKFLSFKALIYEAPDKQFGTKIGNSSKFTGCIGEVLEKKTVFSAGMYTLTSQRNEFVDFSNPYMEESNVPLLRKPLRSSKIWHVLRPLQFSVWMLILVSVAFVSLCCFSFSKFSPLSAWNLNLNFAIIDEVKLKENTWNVIGSLFMQGQDFYPFCISSRIVLAIWWIHALIIFSAYSADLTSFLTVQEKNNFISDINELANRKDLYIIVPKGTNIDSSLAESHNAVYQELNRRKITIDNVDDCPKKILLPSSTNLVCISDRSGMRYVTNMNCKDVYMVPEIFNIAALGFVLEKDSPYKNMIDSYIQILVENGLITKWVRKYWEDDEVTSRNCDGTEGDNSAEPIDFEGIFGICILTCSLFVCGLLFFIIELLWVKTFKNSVDKFLF